MTALVRLNIALKPPDEISKKAILLSQEIAKAHKAIFTLDGKNFFPHITVYAPEFSTSNINKIYVGIEEVAKNTEKFQLFYKEIEAQYNGYIVVHFDLSPAMKNLHKKILSRINPLRQGHIRAKYLTAEYQNKISQAKKNGISKYGFPRVLTAYNPHLSIIRLEDEKKACEVAKNIKWEIEQITIEQIGLYKTGKQGTCTELIKQFNLK